ncbi:MAG: phospho-N-acetylmuramoyl-pentapeptide-transferase [Erysipelotrichaceae bacterium]|nr:phospho-N-acetylmuramoyl-pentapeptide-transferase [Erysipelotrichaceae bacterium]
MDFYLIALIGLILSFLAVFFLMPPYIKALKNHNINQEVSEYALDEYKAKAKTPIMGGLLFVVLPVIVFIIINSKALKDPAAMMVVTSYVLFCVVGFLDDFLIIIRKNNEGLSPKVKLLMEFVFAILVFIIFRSTLSFKIDVPFIHNTIDLKWFIYLPLIILMFLGEANAVNFTDGMDGLCAGVSLISLLGFMIVLFVKGQYNVFILSSCIVGGLIGYLYYNHFPAKIFMGDSGSLALGGLFSAIALITNAEIALLLIGGVFLGEMFCVCLQLSCVKLFKRRVFSYTPIHYAFVLKGLKETTVVKRFYLVTAICVVLGVIIALV